jgi:Na+/H+ antiporter
LNLALLLVAFLSATVAAAILARRVGLPYPIAFVALGLAIAAIPGLPHPRIDPNLIFLIVLPPILHAGGWRTDWFSFKRNIKTISLLAVGLVIFSTIAIAFAAHVMIGLSWPMAFALGAIVSPPDAVAAESVFRKLAVPRRIVAILTGEGLLNDATALVLYRFAVLAAVTGVFSLPKALVSFPILAIGGVAFGLLAGVLIQVALKLIARSDLDDGTIPTVVILIAPYAAYLPADALGVSGVLAAVTTGIYLNRRVAPRMTSQTRLVSVTVWQVMIFLLNALVFLLIGLDLPDILSSFEFNARFALDAGIVCAIAIAVRFIWVYASAWTLGSWRWATVVGWAGMRGIVSLAAALALPLFDASGQVLAGRSEIIVITLGVIVVTLILQGATLSPLIHALGIGESSVRQEHETAARILALEAGQKRLSSLETGLKTAAQWEAMGHIRDEYDRRIAHLKGHLDETSGDQERGAADHLFEREALDAEREEISKLRNAGEVPDEAYRAIAYDLDLADLRLR